MTHQRTISRSSWCCDLRALNKDLSDDKDNKLLISSDEIYLCCECHIELYILSHICECDKRFCTIECIRNHKIKSELCIDEGYIESQILSSKRERKSDEEDLYVDKKEKEIKKRCCC